MSTPASESGLYILHGKLQKPKRRAKFAALALAVPVGFIAGAILGAGTVSLWTREAPTPAPIEAPLAIPHAEATPPPPAPTEAPLAIPHAEVTPPPGTRVWLAGGFTDMVLITVGNINNVLAVFGTRGILAGLLFIAIGFAVGWLLGGPVGAGTVLYALAVGPVTQFFLPWFAYREQPGGQRRGR